MENIKIIIPDPVNAILTKLNDNGYEAYIVGGCVRDSLLNKEPNDWDITTNAKPDEVTKLFDKVIPTGIKHGTVTVMLDDVGYEITTFRIDGEYSDNRRPDSVEFTSSLEDDLSRRDFTINAIAYNPTVGIVDPFNGLGDIKKKIIRCVGSAHNRFKEDPLRVLRAIRFRYQLNFRLNNDILAEILYSYDNLDMVSIERKRDEFNKILLCENIYDDEMIRFTLKLLGDLCKDIRAMFGYNQNHPYHCYDLWMHSLKTITLVEDKLYLKLAALLHDVGKIGCETKDSNGISHYYSHSFMSRIIALNFLDAFKYDNKTKDKVLALIGVHDIRLESKKAVKKMSNRIGIDLCRDLLSLQYADIMAQTPKYAKERLKHIYKAYEYLEEIEAKKECFTRKDLAINGRDIIAAGVTDQKEIGLILAILLNKVIEEEITNEKDILIEEVKKLL